MNTAPPVPRVSTERVQDLIARRADVDGSAWLPSLRTSLLHDILDARAEVERLRSVFREIAAVLNDVEIENEQACIQIDAKVAEVLRGLE